MTEKQTRISVEKLLVDIHAARSFLNRVEFKIRNIFGTSLSESQETGPEGAYTAFEGSGQANSRSDTKNAEKTPSSASDAISTVFMQDDLFRDNTKLVKKTGKQEISRKKGSITLSKREVLDNFRKFAASKQILDLADVNRILGFHKSTSGSFVRLAVARGELGYVPVGRESKFLSVDVRNFIISYFNREKQRKEH